VSYCKKDRLLKTLFDGLTKRKLFPDRSREQIFTGLSDRSAENIVGPAWFLSVWTDGPAYFDMSAFHGNSHKNLLLRNPWANCNQTLVKWSLHGPLPKLCPMIPTSDQDGGQAKNRKKGGWNWKKIFSSETTEPISTKLCWNDPWVVPFQNCVRHFRPLTKMATTAELNLT